MSDTKRKEIGQWFSFCDWPLDRKTVLLASKSDVCFKEYLVLSSKATKR